MKTLLPLLFLIIALTGCSSIEGYNRAYLNDEEMTLGVKDCAQFEGYFEGIREGASGTGTGKTGGGCGCN